LGDSYTIERELGGGGMSRVFVAEEIALGRSVVVKVLPIEMAGQVSVERFRREIRLAASLQQANIVPVISAGDAGGVAYYTMPFVKGESLRARIASKGALPIAECVAILRDVARALAYAHDEGVVHRDIKPENILLSGGTAVVTDFGIAKAVIASATQPGSGTLTQVGLALGTPMYMAPEQALGDKSVDHRADLYAFGVVAYELLAGAPPFGGKNSQALVAAHLSETPRPVQERRADAPAALAQLVMRCLEKDASLRPQSAKMVLDALDLSVTTYAPGAEAAPSRQATIAVLPFANMSADPDAEYFSEGMSEEILNALVRVPGIRVIARTSSFAFKGKSTDVREVGERLGAGVVVEGSVRKAGDRVRITAQLVDTASGHQLWSERYDRELRDVFAVQDEITAAIRDALSEKLVGIGALPRPKPVVETNVYDLFLRGRFLLNKPPDGIPKGMAYLEAVVERAPNYAPALVELAHAVALAANFGAIEPKVAVPRSQELARRASELDPTDPVPFAVLGHNAFHYSYDWNSARTLLNRSLALGPSHPVPAGWYGFYSASLGRHDEAIAATRRAVSLDPLNLLMRFLAIFAHHLARRYLEVITLSDELADIDATFSEAYRLKSFALLQLGRVTDAVAAAETAVQLSAGHAYHRFHLAVAYLAAGRRAEAEAIAAEFVAESPNRSMFALLSGNLLGHLGQFDAAFPHLERYREAGGHWLSMLRADPTYDPLRVDPRFDDLVRRVGIPPWEGPPFSVSSTPATAAKIAPAKPGVAVLPLANLSASADDEYFSDGMTEDIIAGLSQVAGLKVISRTSVMRYKKSDKDMKTIAGELGVSHIVEGTVRRAGNRLRIVAQLIDASNDEHLWAETFDRDMTDVFAIQSEVSERIATALKARLAPDERKRISRRPTVDDEAYNLFLLARHHSNLATADGFERAMDLYRQATERDPQFARAWAARAGAHLFHVCGYYGVRPRDAAAQATRFATRALEIDPDVAEAHSALGTIACLIDLDWNADGARHELALRLSPNMSSVHLTYGNHLVTVGRFDDAVAHAETALELDPASEYVHIHANWLRYMTGRFDEALASLEGAEAQFGRKVLPLTRGETLIAVGRADEAVVAFRDVYERIPISWNLGHVAWGLAAAGRNSEARTALQELHDRERQEYVWPLAIALAYGHLGEMDAAFSYLERSFEDRASWIQFPYGPTFNVFRRDERFTSLTRRIGAIPPRA
jgi:serine/threonine-protein kinase